MSRGQENQVVQQAQQQNATAAQNAQQSFNSAQGDIDNYQQQLAQFAAANPYGQGGQYQSTQNQVLSNTADAAARAAGQALQSQAVRTGQNAGGAIAATEAMQQANERSLAGQEAKANADRINSGAAYGQDILKASEVPAQLQTNLTGQQLNAQDQTLSTQERAAEQPSFMDELGQGLIGAGEGFAAGFGGKMGGKSCWIAAKLFGGWDDPRTKLLRRWIFGPYAETWHGMIPAALYARYGERIAKLMPRHRLLTRLLRKIFEAWLRRALVWQDGERLREKFEQMRKSEVA